MADRVCVAYWAHEASRGQGQGWRFVDVSWAQDEERTTCLG